MSKCRYCFVKVEKTLFGNALLICDFCFENYVCGVCKWCEKGFFTERLMDGICSICKKRGRPKRFLLRTAYRFFKRLLLKLKVKLSSNSDKGDNS